MAHLGKNPDPDEFCRALCLFLGWQQEALAGKQGKDRKSLPIGNINLQLPLGAAVYRLLEERCNKVCTTRGRPARGSPKGCHE